MKRKTTKRPIREEAFVSAAMSDTSVGLQFPEWVKLPEDFKAATEPGKPAETMVEARRRLAMDDFVGGVHHLKVCYFSKGFTFAGADDATKTWLTKSRMKWVAFRLQRDLWREFLLLDCAVVFWMTAAGGTVAKPVVLDGEILDYQDTMGNERLTVQIAKRKLSPEEKAGMSQRWIDAYEKGGKITIDPDLGENFRVITREKLGRGLGTPRLRQVMGLLGTRDLLKAGDWGGAWQGRDVVRLIQGGMKSGENDQSVKLWLQADKKTEIKKQVKNTHGAMDIVANFDLLWKYVYMDMKFFDARKHEGTALMLRQWSGAIGFMLATGQVSPFLLNAFAAEGEADREMMAMLLGDVLNDATFCGRKPKNITLEASWDPNAFSDAKTILETTRFGTGAGLMSFQTGRERLKLDDKQESARNKAAGQSREGYQPPFEAKQGIVGNGQGGRPATQPGDVVEG